MADEKRLIDANGKFTLNAGDLTGHIMCVENGYATVFDRFAKVVCKFSLLDAPTVDAVEVVHGRWERCGGDLHSSGYAIFCSVCNKVHFVHRRYSLGGLNCAELFEKPKYCPSCGAVMGVEE